MCRRTPSLEVDLLLIRLFYYFAYFYILFSSVLFYFQIEGPKIRLAQTISRDDPQRLQVGMDFSVLFASQYFSSRAIMLGSQV
jgi:hypothetical protein